MDQRLKERIETKLRNGQTIKQIYDLASPIDLYIIERMAYYTYVIPMMVRLETNALSEDNYNNCIIDMYRQLRNEGRIYIPPKKRLEK